MKVFFLDDDPERQKFFFHNFSKFAEIDSAYNAKEAIEKFKPPYEVIFLDHDLGGRIFVDSKDINTGSEFCRWLKDNWENDATPIIIHSLNPAGVYSMKSILQGYNVESIPFNKIVSSWKSGELNFLGYTIKDI
jgi:hypothetical protein